MSMSEYFYRINEDGNAAILHCSDGVAVTRLDADMYPVDSHLSVKYEHPEGIILSIADAQKLEIQTD